MPPRVSRNLRLTVGMVLLSAVLAGGWAGAVAFGRWRSAVALAEARRAVASGKFRGARGLLAGIPARAAGRDEVDYLLGVCESALGRPTEAVDAWGRVPPTSVFAARASVQRARAALPLGRFSVVDDLTPAFEDPRFAAEARQTCAFILKVEGRPAEARRLFETGLRFMPSTLASLREIWKLDHQPLDVELSRAELSKAGEKAPDDDRVWLGKANLATWEGKFDESARWLDQCLRRRPDDPAVWRAVLFRARAAGDVAAAWSAFEHLRAADIGPDEVASVRAWLANLAGRVDEETAALTERVTLRPEDLGAYDRLAELNGPTLEGERWRRARAETLRTAARASELLFGENPQAHAGELARLCETLGRKTEAHTWWALQARQRPDDTEAVAALARLETSLPAHEEEPRLLAERLAALRTTPVGTDDLTPSLTQAPRFEDRAKSAGLDFKFDPGQGPRIPPMMMGGGVALLDYDGDGRPDVYAIQGGDFPPSTSSRNARHGDRLFRNRGDGTFDDVTGRARLADLPPGYGFGAAVGDVDGDGRPDLFLTRWDAYRLLRNQGDGTFADVTDAWGLGGPRDWPTSAAFADLDGDGDLDLYVCHYLDFNPEAPGSTSRMPGRPPTAYSPLMYPARPDHLFRNDGGRFTDVSRESGVADADGRGLGVVATDLDGDGRVDLFVANDLTANTLYLNRGGLRFEECGHTAGVAASSLGGYQAGMGVTTDDLDRDGRPDLVVTNFFGESASLFHNLGDGLFNDHTARSGLGVATRYLLGFGVVSLDADNDGRVDLAIANGHVVDNRPTAPFTMPAQLLQAREGGLFADVSERAGPAWGVPRLGRGLAAGDLDDDGRVDLVLVSQDQPLALLRNVSEPRHALLLKLEGTRSNRDAVGSRVVLTSSGRRTVRWRSGGGSYLSASDPRLHFGLDSAERVDRLEVTWPDGSTATAEGLAADRVYRWRQGEPAPVVVRPLSRGARP